MISSLSSKERVSQALAKVDLEDKSEQAERWTAMMRADLSPEHDEAATAA